MEYAATAILAGPVGPAEAALILHHLRGYSASLTTPAVAPAAATVSS